MTIHEEIRHVNDMLDYLSAKKNDLEKKLSLETSEESLSDLANNVSAVFNIGPALLKSGHRHKKLVNARAIFCYIADDIGHSYVKTAKAINRHHTTVIYYNNHEFANRYRDYTEYRQLFDKLLGMYSIEKPTI